MKTINRKRWKSVEEIEEAIDSAKERATWNTSQAKIYEEDSRNLMEEFRSLQARASELTRGDRLKDRLQDQSNDTFHKAKAADKEAMKFKVTADRISKVTLPSLSRKLAEMRTGLLPIDRNTDQTIPA